jgi:hypothetical protein
MSVYQYGNVFKVDGAIGVDTVITTQYGILKHVIWNGGGTLAHKARLTDLKGNIIWAAWSRVITAGPVRCKDLNFNWPFEGLVCNDLDSGELLLYVDKLGANG